MWVHRDVHRTAVMRLALFSHGRGVKQYGMARIHDIRSTSRVCQAAKAATVIPLVLAVPILGSHFEESIVVLIQDDIGIVAHLHNVNSACERLKVYDITPEYYNAQ